MRKLNEIIKVIPIGLDEMDFKIYFPNGSYVNFILPIDSIFYPLNQIDNSAFDPDKCEFKYSDFKKLYNELMQSNCGEMDGKHHKFKFNVYMISLTVIDHLSKIMNYHEKQLYFLQNKEGLIKIGISNNIEKRIDSLEKELECEIYEIKSVSFPRYEKKLHKIFKEYNAFYKGQVEWFTPYPKLTSFIEKVNDNNFIEEYNKLLQNA